MRKRHHSSIILPTDRYLPRTEKRKGGSKVEPTRLIQTEGGNYDKRKAKEDYVKERAAITREGREQGKWASKNAVNGSRRGPMHPKKSKALKENHE